MHIVDFILRTALNNPNLHTIQSLQIIKINYVNYFNTFLSSFWHNLSKLPHKIYMLKTFPALIIALLFLFISCNNKKTNTEKPIAKKVDVEKRITVSYQLLNSKDTIKKILKSLSDSDLILVGKINRADKNFLGGFDSILIPLTKNQKLQQYFPFPFYADFLKDVKKIIFFSYPAQAFAAYENGLMIYTGPTNMGRKADMTPTGLFYTNWKAEETTSTFNDEWNLKWNFNIENKLGVGFHQYIMPGYPASHSCLRLSEKDAMYLYNWADQWRIEGTDSILAHGTPVVVFGSYPFGSAKPWLALAQNANALNITEQDLEKTTETYITDILKKQAERDSIQ